MSLPLSQIARIGAYTVKQHIKGGKYPLVLMLEPLLRCNLACPGCGKIQHPASVLKQRMPRLDEAEQPAGREHRPRAVELPPKASLGKRHLDLAVQGSRAGQLWRACNRKNRDRSGCAGN